MAASEQANIPARNAQRVGAYVHWGRHRVRGWLSGGACRMVRAVAAAQAQLGISGGAAEIGVYHGKLFVLLYLLLRDGEPAMAVDLFDGVGTGERYLRHLEHNLRTHADTDRLIVQAGDSMQVDAAALRHRAGCGFRLFSVDGGHTEEITAHDLATAEGSLSAGGVVILDDCFNTEWPGVSCGLHRHVRDGGRLVPFAIGANKVLLTAPQFHRPYYDAMLALHATRFEREYLGAPVVVLRFDGPVRSVLRRLRRIARRSFAT